MVIRICVQNLIYTKKVKFLISGWVERGKGEGGSVQALLFATSSAKAMFIFCACLDFESIF